VKITAWVRRLVSSSAQRATILIRLLTGSVFLSEGIQKFLFPATLGSGRFLKLGIVDPSFTAPFVGCVEILFGSCLLLGLFTRLSTVPLLAVICVALWTTKLPMLAQGHFWAMAHEARTDYAMLLSPLFLLLVGVGPLFLDRLLARHWRDS
jgi:putative oxidoreductase